MTPEDREWVAMVRRTEDEYHLTGAKEDVDKRYCYDCRLLRVIEDQQEAIECYEAMKRGVAVRISDLEKRIESQQWEIERWKGAKP